MLKVKLLRRPGPGEGEAVLAGFLVLGHAGFGEHGTDIVCAGVSAIAQAALFGLQDILGDEVRSEKKEGYLEVLVNPPRALEEGPRAILRTFELGAKAVERSYPGTVEIREKGL